jgi:diguanylate cyclase (GGDEF)-like protein
MDEKGATFLSGLAPPKAAEAPRAPGRLPLYLIVVSGGIPGAMLRLLPDQTRLGRAAENTFTLAEATVSRQHAAIVIDALGTPQLIDLNSANGTFLNGRRLAPHAPTPLSDGDRVQLGTVVLLKFACLDPSDEQFQRAMYERIVRDDLTGLYNRAYFLDQIGPLASAASQQGLGLAVLILDIDHFKRVNDTHGHDAGDVVLREVATIVRESVRPDDLVARYGGEEFVLALPVAAPDLATERAERIRVNLSEARVVTERAIVRVTASLGLAFAEAGSFRTAGSLLAIADHGLYQAKHSGRNRVVFRHNAPTPQTDLGGTRTG